MKKLLFRQILKAFVLLLLVQITMPVFAQKSKKINLPSLDALFIADVKLSLIKLMRSSAKTLVINKILNTTVSNVEVFFMFF